MIKKLVLDVDGVLTTGQYIYSSTGKVYKIFGSHDKDGLKRLQNRLEIHFITADKIGYPITYARIVKDWKFDEKQLHVVSEEERMNWFLSNCNLQETAFIGDGIHDAPILKIVKAGIAPFNSRIEAAKAAKYVTSSRAGEGAVLDACLWIEEILDGMVKI